MIKFDEFKLKNGLSVLVHEDKTTPMATFNMLYKVGAKDENENKTGFAHLFEHFMFEGSKNIKEFDEEMQKAGGDNNAFTTNDYTNYYNTLPATNIETAFWLESDRMLELDFNQKSLDTQISVVSEEFKENCINRPYGDMWHKLSDMAFQKHPYKWPTIGYNLEHIAAITLQETKDFFYTYYRPNNAILSVSGNVSTNQIKQLAEKWFNDIEPGNPIKRNQISEPEQVKVRRKSVEANVPVNSIFLAFHVCSREEDEYYASDLLSDVLGSGSSSRFYQDLVKNNPLFSSISCHLSGYDEKGLLVIEAKLNENVSMQEAEKGIFETLNTLIHNGIEDRELEKVRNKTINYLAFSNISNSNKAFNLAYFKKLNQLHLMNHEIEYYNNVDTKQVVATAKKYLKLSNCSILYYKTKGK